MDAHDEMISALRGDEPVLAPSALTDGLCVDALLSFSVDAECPHCKEEVDIARDDPDTIVASAIFRNAWHDLKGYEVDCPSCGKQFVIGKVEY